MIPGSMHAQQKTNPNKKIKQEYDCAKSYKASFQTKDVIKEDW